MKYHYYVLVQDGFRTESLFTHEMETKHKYYAFVVRLSESQNLVSVFEHWQRLVSMNLYQTKKKAEEIAHHWNECYKKNGTYAY